MFHSPKDSSYGKFDLTEESLFKEKIQDALNNLLTESYNVDILAEIPCYCDIQFKEREYLTTNEFKNHPFTKKVYDLVNLWKNWLDTLLFLGILSIK